MNTPDADPRVSVATMHTDIRTAGPRDQVWHAGRHDEEPTNILTSWSTRTWTDRQRPIESAPR